MSERTERALLAAILAAFVVLGVVYSVVVPPFEASDELWHYPMVKYIADHWDLPVQDPANVGPWRQEGSQPPLYYFLGALATCWVDTSDMEQVRHLNPHVDNGIATPDGNINLVVHNPALERFPWRGTALAVHLIRLLSVGMGAATVYLTCRLARELFPDRPALALGAAAINAFTPMYLFISGAVNNDNLVVPLCSLALLLMVRVSEAANQRVSEAARRRGDGWQTLLLGCVVGLAALTKESALGLFPLAMLAVSVGVWRQHSEVPFTRRLGLIICRSSFVILPALAVSGWWYWRNWRLYGDPLGWNVFIEILGRRDVPADLAQLWRERYSFLAGYWGNFGGLNVPMPDWTYTVLNTVVVVAALGLTIAVVKSLVQNPKTQNGEIRPGSLGFGIWDFVICHLSFVICLLWAAAVVYGWARWAITTWSSQGRLVFSAISVWSLLLALGIAEWLPRRWKGWALAAFALFLLGLSAAAPFAWIAPAYALPAPLTDAQIAAIPHRLEADFGGVMHLLGYDLETETVEPGGQVGVTLYWEALAPADRDCTVFVHLLGEHDLLIAQRDTFPGLGLLSTAWLEPGDAWADRYVLQVPPTAYTPDTAQVEVGLYDAASGTRLSASTGGDHVRFGWVALRPRPGDLPNPISINFGDRMALVGYDLDRRVARPGETVRMTLHWRALRRMDVNYTVSVQFVNSDWVKAAQQDTWPVGGTAPTSAWQPGMLVEDAYELSILDVPPGVYDVRLTVYRFDEEGGIVPLPTIPEGGRMQATHVVLTRMRVVP